MGAKETILKLVRTGFNILTPIKVGQSKNVELQG